jgi:hypothetical protein
MIGSQNIEEKVQLEDLSVEELIHVMINANLQRCVEKLSPHDVSSILLAVCTNFEDLVNEFEIDKLIATAIMKKKLYIESNDGIPKYLLNSTASIIGMVTLFIYSVFIHPFV